MLKKIKNPTRKELKAFVERYRGEYYIDEINPNTFGCDQCANDNVPLEQLHRSKLKDGHSDACFCSAKCREAYDSKILKDAARFRLYAAAPELLEAAKNMVHFFGLTEPNSEEREAMDALRFAIAKAEGNEK